MSNARLPVPRFALALVALMVAGALVGSFAIAADPGEGEVSLDQRSVGWNGDEYAAGKTMLRQGCDLPGDSVCDHYTLTVDVPASHWETHAGGVDVKIAWESPDDDFDLHILDADGNVVGSSETFDNTGERVFVENASGTYTIQVNPYDVTDSGYEGGAFVESRAVVGDQDIPSEPVSGVPCADGRAGPFPCKGVDLGAFLPLDAIGGGQLNDIWGWTDPQSGREYALVGKTSGTAFVDVTEPEAPVYLGDLPSFQPVETIFNVWRDVKVHDNHAFVVSEEPSHGMQVFDLTRLRGVTAPRTWTEDAHYALFGNAHNIAINEDSGFAYAIGTSTCQGGPHVVDVREPTSPKPAGCVFQDGYTHDTQCVNYDGPDERFAGREICFSSNEDTVTIVDVTDKLNPVQLSRTTYDGAEYTHQGWLTEDGGQFIVNDELDEQASGEPTTTRIFDVARLDNPRLIGAYRAQVASIDHNLYVKDGLVYEANYRSGLRILDAADVANGTLTERAFFDVYPEDDAAEFNGAWSSYPYFGSGTVVVSGIEQGLFVLRPQGATSAEPSTEQPSGGGGGGGGGGAGPPAPTPPAATPGAGAGPAPSAPPAASPAPRQAVRGERAASTSAPGRPVLRVRRLRGNRVRLSCRRTLAPCTVRVLTRRAGRLRTVRSVRIAAGRARTIRLAAHRRYVLRAFVRTADGSRTHARQRVLARR